MELEAFDTKTNINESIVSQHAEEVSFLWLQRCDAVADPHYALKDIVAHDERIEAHLDGLRIAANPGWEIVAEQLQLGEPGEVFTAATLAFERDDSDKIDTVLEIAIGDEELERAVASALGWVPSEVVENRSRTFITSDKPELIRLGICAYALHRRDPEKALDHCVTHADNRVRSRALRAVGELGRTDLLPLLTYGLDDDDDESRFWRAWSSAMLGQRKFGALDILHRVAQSDGPRAGKALQAWTRCAPKDQVSVWIQDWLRDPNQARLGLIGIGALGDASLVPHLFGYMQEDEVARVAGEAFSMITGIDLAYDDLDRDAPEEVEAGPTEEPEDEDVALDPDEDLPWPDSTLISERWQNVAAGFTTGERYLRGERIEAPGLNTALREGMQRQRIAAALELRLLQSSGPMFEVRAPGKRQKGLL